MSAVAASAAAGPVLRDIHLPPPPAWWPPAWGWWAVLALSLLGLALAGWGLWRLQRRRRRQAAIRTEFDAAASGAVDAPARLRGVSECLRRAARLQAPQAGALRGEAWLRFLDGDDPARPFSAGVGRLLDDGPYRPAIDEAEVEALLPVARRRYLELARRA